MWFNKLIAQTLPAVPKPIVRRVSARYIAGETQTEALETIQELNARGMRATLDVLGEFVGVEAEARRAGAEYIELIRAIENRDLDSNVSLKLTQMGLKIDTALCHEITRNVVEEARRRKNFVRIDMEDSSCTDATLDIFRRLHQEYPETVGCVIQSYLRRSLEDVRGLAREGANVRLCKGIYIEPRDIAFKKPVRINESYMALLGELLGAGVYTGIATHDEALVDGAYHLIEKLGLGTHQYEFQMLLGVQERLRQSILDRGHRLRVYVPFGSHWYAYSVRRLKENPQIAGHVIRGFFNGHS